MFMLADRRKGCSSGRSGESDDRRRDDGWAEGEVDARRGANSTGSGSTGAEDARERASGRVRCVARAGWGSETGELERDRRRLRGRLSNDASLSRARLARGVRSASLISIDGRSDSREGRKSSDAGESMMTEIHGSPAPGAQTWMTSVSCAAASNASTACGQPWASPPPQTAALSKWCH